MVSSISTAPKGTQVKVLPSIIHPATCGTFTPSILDGFGEVLVTEGKYKGEVFYVPFSHIEVLEEASSEGKAGTSSTLPNCQVNAHASSSNDSVNVPEQDVTQVMPHFEDEPLTPDVKVFQPGVTPRRLRKARKSEVGKMEGYPKGFSRPILRSQKLAALKRAEDAKFRNAHEVEKGLYVRVDWLQGKGVVSHPQRLLQYLSDCLGEEVFFEPSRQWVMGKTYMSSGRCVNGFRIGFNPMKTEEGGGWEVLVSFPGSVLGTRANVHWWKMCKVLRQIMKFTATRFDAALDDLEKELDPEVVKAAILAGNVKRFSPKACVFTNDPNGGWTLRMGGAGSECSLNLYNKEVESGGELPSWRLEARLKRSLAEQALTEWLSVKSKNFEVESAQKLAGLVVGQYDFIDRAAKPNEKHLDRIPRLAWWQKFLDRVKVTPIRHKRIRPEWSVVRFWKWLEHQILTPLATLREGLGEEAFWALLTEKLDFAKANKMKPWHWHRVKKYRDEMQQLTASV